MHLLFAGFRSLSAQRVAGQREAVVALHDAVQDGVGDGGIAAPCMPVIDRQLAGNDCGLAAGRHSSLVVARSAHVGMVGANPFGSGSRRALVAVILQDIFHVPVLAGADLQGQRASCLQPHFSIALR